MKLALGFLIILVIGLKAETAARQINHNRAENEWNKGHIKKMRRIYPDPQHQTRTGARRP